MKPSLIFAALIIISSSTFAYDGNSDTWLENAYKNESTSPPSRENDDSSSSLGETVSSWFSTLGGKKNASFDPDGIIAKPKSWMRNRKCLPYYKDFFKKMKSRRMQAQMKKCPNRPNNIAKDISIIVDKAGMDQRLTKKQQRQKPPQQRVFVKISYSDGRPDKLWGPLKISTGSSHYGDMKMSQDKNYRRLKRKNYKTAHDRELLKKLKDYYDYKFATPEGTFDLNTEPRHSISTTRAWCVQNEKSSGAAMPNASQIFEGIFFHSGYPGGITGYPASHGCIRMTYNQSEELYCLLKQKNRAGISNDQRTTVEIHKDLSYLEKSDFHKQLPPPPLRIAKPAYPFKDKTSDDEDEDSDDEDSDD